MKNDVKISENAPTTKEIVRRWMEVFLWSSFFVVGGGLLLAHDFPKLCVLYLFVMLWYAFSRAFGNKKYTKTFDPSRLKGKNIVDDDFFDDKPEEEWVYYPGLG